MTTTSAAVIAEARRHYPAAHALTLRPLRGRLVLQYVQDVAGMPAEQDGRAAFQDPRSTAVSRLAESFAQERYGNPDRWPDPLVITT